MASSSILQCTRNRGLSLQLAALVWIMIWDIFATETAAPILLRGEVGGNVTFHCPVVKTKKVKFVYFQIADKYINGYHTLRDIEMPKPWSNTRMDRNNTRVDMINLDISHNGVYQCIIRYSDDTMVEVDIKLSVTANYSKPSVSTSCDGGNLGCFVTCASHGGYPETKMRLNIPVSGNTSGQMFKAVNSSQVSSPSTMLFSSSSTTYINCSNGQWRHLSCSVGEVTSDLFSVCEPRSVPEPHNNNKIIIACVAVIFILAFIIIIIIILHYCCKKKKTGATPVNVRQKCNTNGNLEETIGLKDNKEGTEAS